MSNTSNGGPAFPNLKAHDCGPRDERNGGMNLIDWFAGQALANQGKSLGHPGDIAKQAYSVAAAMLVEREKYR